MKTALRRSNALLRAAAAAALLALLAAALLAIDTARAQLPSDLELIIGLVDDSDDTIPPGGEASVRAELRFTAGNADSRGLLNYEQLLLDCENLEVSAADLRLGGGFHWEDPDALGYRLDIEDQQISLIKSADPADPIESPASVATPRPSFVVKAVAGKYLAGTARGSGAAEDAETEPNTAHLINLCGVEVAKIDPPAGTAAGSFGGVTLPHTNAEDALEMWAEDEDTLWLFIGSRLDAVDDRERVGRLHVYKADLSASPTTVTLETTLSPPSSEYLNKPGDDYPNYGHSVVVSGDGSTLAVSAPVMNGIGAVYVYSKPSGTGEDWGDITYAAGVKVTTVETPAWGDWSSAAQIAATRPFNWLSASCDAYCMEVATLLIGGSADSTVYNGVGFGGYAGDDALGLGHTTGLALSNDGTVLVVGAPYKAWGQHAPAPLRDSFPVTSIPGIATSGYFRGRVTQGEAYVFVAPSGGWTAAPLASAGTPAQTEIAAGADANSFDPDTHFAPGPSRRIVDEDAILSTNFPWGTAFFHRLHIGLRVTVSPDGSTIFVGTNIWQYGYTKASASAWDGAGWTTGDYNYAPGLGSGGAYGGAAFSPDGTRLVMGNVGHVHQPDSSERHTGRVCPLPDGEEDVGGRGGVYVFTRVSTTWEHNANASQTEVCSPQQAEGAHFGRSIHFTTIDSQVLMVVSEPYSDSDASLSRVWLLPLPGDTTTLTEQRCRGELLEGVYTRSCPLKLPAGASLAVPEGTEEGPFTISGRVSVGPDPNPRALRGQFQGQIGVVRELAEAHLELATDINYTPNTAADDRPYPSVISEGEFTFLSLRILNEDGKPAATGSVASVLVQTTQGGLTSRVEGGACAGASGRASCSIPGSALTATNSGDLRIKLDHTGKAGDALVWATVFGADQGETPGQTLTTERITVTLAGPAAQLTISAPNAGVLSVNAESAEGAEQAGADTDRRDELTLTVGALDAAGNAVPLPTPEPARTVLRRISGLGIEIPPENAEREPRQISLARLTGPDGKRVTSGVEIVWPVGGTLTPKLDAAGHEFVELNVNRAADEPLAAGQYTLELQLGHNVLGQQTFTVAGPPAAIALSQLQGDFTPGGRFTVEAALTDADGNPVPDGTRVSWGDTPLGAFASIVQLSAQSTTTAGKASATYLALSPGRTTISAVSGDLRDLALATVADTAPPPPPPSLADSLAQPNTVGSNSWLGATSVRASALLNELSGVNSVQVWQSGRWFRYSRTGEGPSIDITIHPGAVLWFGN